MNIALWNLERNNGAQMKRQSAESGSIISHDLIHYTHSFHIFPTGKIFPLLGSDRILQASPPKLCSLLLGIDTSCVGYQSTMEVGDCSGSRRMVATPCNAVRSDIRTFSLNQY